MDTSLFLSDFTAYWAFLLSAMALVLDYAKNSPTIGLDALFALRDARKDQRDITVKFSLAR
jgi:hypothetical protein